MKKTSQTSKQNASRLKLTMLFLCAGIGIGYAADSNLPSVENGKLISREIIQPTADATADDRPWVIQGQVLEQTEPPFPLAGVNIIIKGTNIGTVSDLNGYFSVNAKRGDIIQFNYLGFKSFEHVVSRAISNLNVSLSEDVETLDEVVVTGFSEEKKLSTGRHGDLPTTQYGAGMSGFHQQRTG